MEYNKNTEKAVDKQEYRGVRLEKAIKIQTERVEGI